MNKWEKIKFKFKNADIKTLLKALLLVAGLGVIVLMTVVHLELDPTLLDFNAWLSKTILLIGISVFGILMGESIGRDKQMANPNGMYQRSLESYDKIMEKLKPILLYFNDFLVWYREKETEKKEIDYLTNHGIKEAKLIVQNIKKIDLEALAEHPLKIGDDIIGTKTLEELVYIQDVASGDVVVKSYTSAYYMTAFESHMSKSELELPYQLDKDIKFNKGFSRTFKLVSFMAFSLIVGMLGVNDIMQGNDLTAWWDLTLRVFTLLSCLFSGWCTSIVGVKLEALKVKNKVTILEKFDVAYSTREFVPTDYQDLARKEYEAYQEQGAKENEQIDGQE